jgi:predicted phosphodiesterase
MRCWLISDTHNRHEQLQIPQGLDAVIHCGDESQSMNATKNEQHRVIFSDGSRLSISSTKFLSPETIRRRSSKA